MDNERARDLLSAYRPSGADRGDPAFAEALQQARADARLNAWFETELAGDRAIAGTLRSIRAPQDLRARILAEGSETRRSGWAAHWKPALASLAAAASIALAIFTIWPERPVSSFDTIIAAAAAESEASPDMNFYSSSPGELITWLDENDAPAPGALPPGLAALPTVGCRKLDWDGVPASLLGFRLQPDSTTTAGGGARDPMIFLYTVDQSSCSGGAAGREPVVFSRHDQSIATWRDATRFYIAVAQIPESALRAILSGAPAVALDASTSESYQLQNAVLRLTRAPAVVSSHLL